MKRKDPDQVFLFYTFFSIEECIEKITQAKNTKEYGWLRCNVNGNYFSIHFFKGITNSFFRNLSGEFYYDKNGTTIIKCKFTNSIVKLFRILWFFMLTVSSLIVIYDFVSGENQIPDKLGFIPALLIMFAAGIIVPKLGLSLSKSNEKYILEFLKKELMLIKLDQQENSEFL